MTDCNIDVLDARGNIIHHTGPSTEWWKTYDDQGRETLYTRADGQTAATTYDADGAPTVTWEPPIQVDVESV